MRIKIGPKNPNQLSVEREKGVSGVFVSRAPISISPEIVWFMTAGVTGAISSIMNKDKRRNVIPIPTIVHFQIFLRKIPGSKIPRISPISGKI